MKDLTSYSYHSSSQVESCLKSNFHNANACITSRLGFFAYAEKIKGNNAMLYFILFYLYIIYKILIIKQVSYFGKSSEITLMFIIYHHNKIV